MRVNLLLILFSLVLLSGCSWIELTAQGDKVRVLARNEVAGCKYVGKTTATVTDKVIGLKRKEHIVRENLETLARNAAANMGGDTIVAETQIEQGKQTFNVYQCVRR
ncbi:MAG: DUF4156 domain-containing protein [Thioalkalispiraceae bacterium]|jgi:hypothetical protein